MTGTQPRSATPAAGLVGPARERWIDNVRVAIIVGVIVAHVSTAYILDFPWYYEERTASPVTEAVVGGIVGLGLLFGMGVLFLVAGLLSAPALARKGPARFAWDRILRLGAPLIVFVFVIDSLTDFIGYRAEGGDDGLSGYLGLWWSDDADLGPGWFIAALLAFSLAYAAWRSLRPAPASVDGVLDARRLVVLGALVAVGSYLVRIEWPFGSRSVFGLNLWEFPQMIGLFAFGAVATERRWLDNGLPDRLWRRCATTAIAGGLLLLALGGAIALSGDDEPFLGGLRPEATLLPVVEATIAVSTSLWVVEWFRRHWDRGGHVAYTLGRSSYAAYLVHPPVVVGLSAAFAAAAIPVEVKFVAVSVLGVAGSFALGRLLTVRGPLSRVL